MDQKLLEAIDAEIDAQTDEMITLLSDLVAAKTVTGNEGPGQEVVIDQFETMGLEPDVWEPSATELRNHEGFFETSTYVDVGYEGRPNVATRIPGASEGKSLSLSGHIDVVSADESGWDTDPWTLTRDGDRLYRRNRPSTSGLNPEAVHKNYYDIDAVTVGPYGERLHGPNECTTVSSLTETAKTLARIAIDYCGVTDTDN